MKVGDRNGKIVILQTDQTVLSGYAVVSAYLIRCDCGVEKLITRANFSGTKSCGCERYKKPLKHSVGDTSGILTIIETGRFIKSNGIKKHYSAYLVRCGCGIEKLIAASGFDVTKSCGCAQNRKTIHGDARKHTKHPRLYTIWNGMNSRCYTETTSHYNRYGGRGITVCNEWKRNYITFRDWALSHGYSEELELDRRDNNGNYTPENCRWITHAENMRNRG